MFKIRTLLMAFIAITIFASCGKDYPNPAPTPTIAAESYNNLSYGTDPLQKMDVYLPAGRSTDKTKLLIIVHGGGWSGGDKADMTPDGTLQRLWPEVAFANINYRLAAPGSNQHPAQLADIASAINFIKSKKTEWNITDTFGIIGASAGAHLSLLYLAENPTQQNIRVCADLFGPTSFVDANWLSNPIVNSTVVNYLGSSYASNPTLWRSTSPLHRVAAGFKPTIMFHGTADIVVPISQSDSLDMRFTQLSVPHSYIKYPNDGHGFNSTNNADMIIKLVAYFKQYL